MSSPFSVISLFSGCGGSSLRYEMAGGKILLAVEWDKDAVETYRLNFPGTPIWGGDICDLSVEGIMSMTGLRPGDLDVLDGSPPCQGFSHAGRREFTDPRNQLYNEYVRILEGLKPKAFMMENVSGMVHGKMRLLFADVMRKMKGAGYNVRARLMNAKWYGVPQARQRLIFIGIRQDLGVGPSHPVPKGRAVPVSMIGDLGNVQDPSTDHVWLDESPQGKNTLSWHRARGAKQGESYGKLRMIGRDRWDGPASCIRASGIKIGLPCSIGNSACHPLYTRYYSVLEVKRICTFPDDFRFTGEWFRAYWQMGNSVPPLFMKAIAEHVWDALLLGHGQTTLSSTEAIRNSIDEDILNDVPFRAIKRKHGLKRNTVTLQRYKDTFGKEPELMV